MFRRSFCFMKQKPNPCSRSCYLSRVSMNTSRFRFVIGEEICEFHAHENNKSIRGVLEKVYPDCTLVLEYCQCFDACSCENGHYIATSRWISQDPGKPWIGSREHYEVPLEIVTSRGLFHYVDFESETRFEN